MRRIPPRRAAASASDHDQKDENQTDRGGSEAGVEGHFGGVRSRGTDH